MSSISEEEDSGPSLKELVTKSLEANGVLGKLQAQLRASVFLILEEECQEKNIPLVNQQSLKLLSTPSGKIAISLIQDFLRCLHLDFTLSVFNPETASSDIPINRDMLEEKFKAALSNCDENHPLLLHLIEDIMKNQQDRKNGKQGDNLSSNSANSSRLSNGISHSKNLENGEHLLEDKTVHSNGFDNEKGKQHESNHKAESLSHNGIHNQDLEKEIISPGLSESSSLSEKDTLAGLEKEYEEEEFSSLSNVNNVLPQEDSVSDGKDIGENSSRKTSDTEVNGQPASGDKSDGLSKVSENPKSVSEDIEEDIDDLLSITSEISNNTKDITVSKDNSVLADYQESL